MAEMHHAHGADARAAPIHKALGACVVSVMSIVSLVRGQFGVVWGQFGIGLGLVWDWFGIVLGLVWIGFRLV